MKAKVSSISCLGIIGYTCGVIYLHYNTPMDSSIYHVKINSCAFAFMYFHYTVPKNEFQMNFRPNGKKRDSKEILGKSVYNFGVERYFVKTVNR